jgi:hypothetical protein
MGATHHPQLIDHLPMYITNYTIHHLLLNKLESPDNQMENTAGELGKPEAGTPDSCPDGMTSTNGPSVIICGCTIYSDD